VQEGQSGTIAWTYTDGGNDTTGPIAVSWAVMDPSATQYLLGPYSAGSSSYNTGNPRVATGTITVNTATSPFIGFEAGSYIIQVGPATGLTPVNLTFNLTSADYLTAVYTGIGVGQGSYTASAARIIRPGQVAFTVTFTDVNNNTPGPRQFSYVVLNTDYSTAVGPFLIQSGVAYNGANPRQATASAQFNAGLYNMVASDYIIQVGCDLAVSPINLDLHLSDWHSASWTTVTGGGAGISGETATVPVDGTATLAAYFHDERNNNAQNPVTFYYAIRDGNNVTQASGTIGTGAFNSSSPRVATASTTFNIATLALPIGNYVTEIGSNAASADSVPSKYMNLSVIAIPGLSDDTLTATFMSNGLTSLTIAPVTGGVAVHFVYTDVNGDTPYSSVDVNVTLWNAANTTQITSGFAGASGSQPFNPSTGVNRIATSIPKSHPCPPREQPH
jgi:hypothetical protein